MSASATRSISPAEARFQRRRRAAGLVLGPAAFVAVWVAEMSALTHDAHRLAAIAAMTVVLWVTEAIPLWASAALAPLLAAILGIASFADAFDRFTHPLIFLFLGGFVLAGTLSARGSDRRAALWLLGQRFVAGSPDRATAAVAGVAFGLSMWISNTATTAMMVPIAIGLSARVHRLLPDDPEVQARHRLFAEGMLIALAYAASLGGLCTPIGTAPNLIALSLLDDFLGIRIDFLQWMVVAMPVAIVGLLAMLVLARRRFRAPVARVEGLTAYVERERLALGPMRSGERRALIIFGLAVVGWIMPAILRLTVGVEHPWTGWYREHLNEGRVAMLCAAAVILCPRGKSDPPTAEDPGRSLIRLRDALRIDWGTLVLLGGGFALGKLTFDTGLALAIGDSVLQVAPGGGALLLVLATVTVLYMTELTSNTATTSMMLPVLIPLAISTGDNPVVMAVTVTMAASFAFMLPVSTPPNAIAYGTGHVRLGTMMRFGAWLDLVGLAILLAAAFTFLPAIPWLR